MLHDTYKKIRKKNWVYFEADTRRLRSLHNIIFYLLPLMVVNVSFLTTKLVVELLAMVVVILVVVERLQLGVDDVTVPTRYPSLVSL